MTTPGGMALEESLAARFSEQRPRLRLLAQRLLGGAYDADEAVQEAWLRLQGVAAGDITNLEGWLTTVTGRIALDMIRARNRSAAPVDPHGTRDVVTPGAGPEDEAVRTDSVSAALLVVLDTLTPAERVAFVLHDLFAVPFVEVAEVLQRSPSASKMLASRARQKVHGHRPSTRTVPRQHQAVVDAFLDAARTGNFEALVSLLHPEIVMHSDEAASAMGAPSPATGTSAVARVFSGRALGAQPAVIDDVAGLVWIVQDRPKAAWELTIIDEQVVRIDMVADPDTLADADITSLEVRA